MKDNFTLLDEEFAYFATRVAKEFEKSGMKYALVGNVAVQAQILSMISRKLENAPISHLKDSMNVREYLRPTSNVDIAIKPDPNEQESDLIRRLLELRTVLGNIRAEVSGSEEFLLSYSLERPGTKRMTFRSCVDENCQGFMGVRVLTGAKDLTEFDQEVYDAMVQRSYALKIPYSSNGYTLEFDVASPKDLLLIKGVQARPKDDMDVGTLVQAISLFGKDGFDAGKIEKVFGEKYAHAFPRFAALTEKYVRH